MDHPLGSDHLDVPSLLRDHNLQPNKSLGQNFLIEPKYLQLVVEAGEINDQDTVLEIGSGVGNLTRLLASRAGQVVAVEIDQNLIPILIETTSGYGNILVKQGDILDFKINELISKQPFKVIANIPYYIASKIIRYLMTGSLKPIRLILTVQKEVADRICAQSGKYNLLALSVQVFGEPSIVSHIPAGSFYPVPKVDSAIVRIDTYSEPRISSVYLDTYFYLARAGFSQKRKNLRNSLSAGTTMDKETAEDLLNSAGIDITRRAETLSIDEWRKLTLDYQEKVIGKDTQGN